MIKKQEVKISCLLPLKFLLLIGKAVIPVKTIHNVVFIVYDVK